MIDGLRSTDDPYLTGLFVTDKPEFDLGKWIYSNAPRISTYSLTFHAEDCKDECPLNRLYFPARRSYFEAFVKNKSIACLGSESNKFIYTSYGSGLLKQDLLILQQLAPCLGPRELQVNLIDQLYAPPGEKIVRDDFRIHDATIDFWQKLSKMFPAADKLKVLMYRSAEAYVKHCVEEESSKSDVVTAADCGPEIQKHFLLLLEKSLKPRGFWSVLFKYSDGSAEELKAPNLPADVRQLLKQRGPKSHCCIIYGKQDFKYTPRVYNLSLLPDESAWVEFAPGGIGQLKWDNRNLFNAKITLFAVEYWRWNYLQFMQKPPPQSPLCSSALSKRLVWVKKAAKRYADDVNKLSDDSIAPLHYAIANCAKPDVTESKIITLLLAAKADPNIRAKGCGVLTCTCPVQDSTPLHWAALYNASESAKVLLGARGVNINAHDSTKQTPLHVAAQRGSFEVLQLLVAAGSDLSLKDANGKTAAQLAGTNQELVKVFVKPK